MMKQKKQKLPKLKISFYLKKNKNKKKPFVAYAAEGFFLQ